MINDRVNEKARKGWKLREMREYRGTVKVDRKNDRLNRMR